jgi:hypothetical protein
MKGKGTHNKYYELGLIALLTAFLAALKLAGFRCPWWLVTVPLGLVFMAIVAGGVVFQKYGKKYYGPKDDQ